MMCVIQEEFAVQLEKFCTSLNTMYDEQMALQAEKQQLVETVSEMEQKLIEAATLRMELNERVKLEAEARQNLEATFVGKLERLSMLVMAEREGSTYDLPQE